MKKAFTTIVAFAGRRIDAPDEPTPRFPLTQVDVVQKKIEALFRRDNAKTLICSAACGADLIALQVAQNLGIDSRIILPFAPECFRVTSVMDRPGTQEWNWGTLFDQVIGLSQGKGELVVLETHDDSQSMYQAVNHAILNEVVQQGRIQSGTGASQEIHDVQAVIVWDGHARGSHDLTWHFAEEARSRGLVVKEILTWP